MIEHQVYPLADLLDMTLILDWSLEGSVKPIISSGPSLRWVPMGGTALPLLCSVKAAYVCDKLPLPGSAVLMRVLGDLYLYVCYSSAERYVTVFLIDADKQHVGPTLLKKVNGKAPAVAAAALKPGVVARFGTKEGEWEWEKEQVGADIVGFGKITNRKPRNKKEANV